MTDTRLQTHLAHTQHLAPRLRGVTAAIACLENEEECREGRSVLVYIAEELAFELNNALDSVNIPKGEIL